MGNLIRVDTPNGIINEEVDGEGYHYEYDHMDRLMSIKNPLGTVQQSIRDSEGNIIKEVNPNYYDAAAKDGKGIEFVYDKDNRKIKTVFPDGGIERLFYDANGNVVKHISPEYYNSETDDGLGVCYTYDSLNRLKEVINEEGKVEKTFEYNFSGNIIKETDIEGFSTLYSYDLIENLIEKKTPVEVQDGQTKYNVIYYEYDDNSNKVLEKHGLDLVNEDEICYRCNEIKFKYDSEDRLIEVSDKYGAKAKYRYDCLNNKTFESFKINDDTAKAVHYIYDKEGNLTKRIDRNGNNQDRSYNIDGNLTLLEAYKKDKENKLNVVRQQLEYNPDGTISGAVFNNMYYNYDYNIEGLLKKKIASGKTLLEYTYDKTSC